MHITVYIFVDRGHKGRSNPISDRAKEIYILVL